MYDDIMASVHPIKSSTIGVGASFKQQVLDVTIRVSKEDNQAWF